MISSSANERRHTGDDIEMVGTGDMKEGYNRVGYI